VGKSAIPTCGFGALDFIASGLDFGVKLGSIAAL
jgi:hypothetical protein